MNWKRMFKDTVWDVAYRKVGDEKAPYRVIKTKRRYWCADPFVVDSQSETYLFCEMMDRKESRGKLGFCKLNDPNPKMEVIGDLGCHTSYPCVFFKNGWYMIPETVDRKNIELYRAVDFPTKWEKVGELLSNVNAVDTTVFERNGNLAVFIYEYTDNGKKAVLSVGDLDVAQCKIVNVKQIKRYESKIGRPAGNTICQDGVMIRPTQYGVNFYGEKIEFLSFDLENENYTEEKLFEMTVKDIQLSNTQKKYYGIHTYNASNRYEVVDLLRCKTFPERPLCTVLKKLKLGGYRYYER